MKSFVLRLNGCGTTTNRMQIYSCMKKTILAHVLAIGLTSLAGNAKAAVTSVQSQIIAITTIDNPLAGGGTYVTGIDGSNIVGYYTTVNQYQQLTGNHGFIYNGSTFTTIDNPERTRDLEPV